MTTSRGSAANRRFVLAAAILGSSMAFIDGSVVGVALPAIQRELSASVRGAQWIVNGYMLMLGALLLVGGAAGDRFGRRRVFALGVLLFTAASMACGLASSTAMLVASRLIQGVGAALLVPASLAIITGAFEGAARGRAIGTWAGFSALTTAFGPVLGGWLVDAWSWRAIFFLNAPVALCVLLLLRRVPESTGHTGRVDFIGGALATLGLGAIAWGLTGASDLGWTHGFVLGALAGGMVVLGLFVWWEGRAPAPMMPLAMFRSPAFSGANAMTFFLYFALSGSLFFLPFNLIRLQGYSAAAAGASFLPFTLIMGVLSRWSGGLLARYPARALLTVGPLITAAGFALLAVPGIGGSFWVTFFPGMVVLGFGMAVSVAPLTTVVMSAVDGRHTGAASGVNNAAARVAALLAVALLGAVAVGVFGSALASRLDAIDAPPDVRSAMAQQVSRLAEAEVPAGVPAHLRSGLQRALDEAFLRSFRVVTLIAAAFAAISGVCAAITLRE
ncbi:MAG TPA: MFS transporter [Vicinamibacterales bacterium]